MKTKKTSENLTLNKKTISNLDQIEMGKLLGGTWPTIGPTCLVTQTLCGQHCPQFRTLKANHQEKGRVYLPAKKYYNAFGGRNGPHFVSQTEPF